MRLILVRHARVELRNGIPADQWQLSEAGRRDAASLARWEGWRGLRVIASSPEAKAVDTARPIAAAAELELVVEADLREAGRPSLPLVSRERHVAQVAAYLRGEPLPGWEAPQEVTRRVTTCIERLLATASGDAAIVSHGLALSLYLGSSFTEWERIPLPAVAVLDAATRRVIEPWTSIPDTRAL